MGPKAVTPAGSAGAPAPVWVTAISVSWVNAPRGMTTCAPDASVTVPPAGPIFGCEEAGLLPRPPHPVRTRHAVAMAPSSVCAQGRRFWARAGKISLLLDPIILSCTTTHDDSVVLNDMLGRPAILHITREIYPA